MASWPASSAFHDDSKISQVSPDYATSNLPNAGLQRSNSQSKQQIRLACVACQRKKVKCDRSFPCGQCSRSNLQCVASTRKPRARHTGKRAVDSELRSRISKLESLVETLSGDTIDQPTSSPDDEADIKTEDARSEQPRKTPAALEKYLGSQFWSSLSGEVHALREALEDDPEEADDDDNTQSTSSSSAAPASADYDLLLCPPGTIYIMPGALSEPNQELSARLCNEFCDNFDCIGKLFHRPTLQDFMVRGANYLGHDHMDPGNRALKAAVWFSAVSTFSDAQCVEIFGQSQPDMVSQFKRLADVRLAEADLMNTTSIATLQGFVSYLTASRLTDPGRRVWTLVALALRIAHAMGLHREAVPRSPFMTQIRRRLFHQIRFVDAHASVDRGSEPMITPGSFDAPFPHNVNDSEFDMTSTSIPNHSGVLTDMSFALLTYTASARTQLLFVPDGCTPATWEQRIEMAEEFEKEIRRDFLDLCDANDPFHRMLFVVGTTIACNVKLRAVRPSQRKDASSPPPRVDSPYVLRLAINALRSNEQDVSDMETSRLRWMVWVPWHALAVALAGLCSVRDTELANEAWVAAERGYARSLRFVAEGRHGMLWRPIEKLYRIASAFRDHREHEPTPTGITPPDMKWVQHTRVGAAYPEPQAISNGSDYDMTNGTSSNNDMMANNVQAAATAVFPQRQQAPQQQQQPLLHPTPGVMPTTGVPNADMDLGDLGDLRLNADDGFDFGSTWMDFERILQGMSNPADRTLGTQWLANVAADGSWPHDLHQDMM